MNFCTVTKLFLHFSTVYERKSSVEDSAECFPAKIHGTFRLAPCSVKSNPAETGKKKKSGIFLVTDCKICYIRKGKVRAARLILQQLNECFHQPFTIAGSGRLFFPLKIV